MGDKFLRQGIDYCSRGNVTVDFLVTEDSELIGDVKTGGSLGCSGGICNLEEYRSAKE